MAERDWNGHSGHYIWSEGHEAIIRRAEKKAGKEIPELFEAVRMQWDDECANQFCRKGMALAEEMQHTIAALNMDFNRPEES